jgi:hypothetical protein
MYRSGEAIRLSSLVQTRNNLDRGRGSASYEPNFIASIA